MRLCIVSHIDTHSSLFYAQPCRILEDGVVNVKESLFVSLHNFTIHVCCGIGRVCLLLNKGDLGIRKIQKHNVALL